MSSLTQLLDISARIGRRRFIVRRTADSYELYTFRKGDKLTIKIPDIGEPSLKTPNGEWTGKNALINALEKEWPEWNQGLQRKLPLSG